MKKILNFFIIKIIIKNILLIILSFFISLLYVNANNIDNEINKKLEKYYEKLDINFSDIEKKIEKIKIMEEKISNIIKIKGAKLSILNKKILLIVKSNLIIKKNEYKIEQKNNKNISLSGSIENKNSFCNYKGSILNNGDEKKIKKSLYIPNGRKYFLINYICLNGNIVELSRKIELTSCNPGYIKKNNWCIGSNSKKQCKLNGLYLEDKNQAGYLKSFIIKGGRKYYFVNFECNNGELLELNKDFRKINCNPGYIKKGKNCIKKIKLNN